MELGNNLKSSKDFCKKYYPILCHEFPDFLNDYINSKEMQRIHGTSISCGCNYTNLFNFKFFYSNLDHSIAVALIIWNFTKDKKATIAGLFHDISTPCFKHCIDFLNGDHVNQESTEEDTEKIIASSNEIMQLLKRDDILLEEVIEYKDYPIADNPSPKLSSDRLEYTLSNLYFWDDIYDLNTIEKIYKDLTVVKNEEGIDELCFNHLEIADLFIRGASILWYEWTDSKDKLTMQFIADEVGHLINEGLLSKDDLYQLPEMKVINLLIHQPNEERGNRFLSFMNAKEVKESEVYVEGTYCKDIKAKKRYINPLVKTKDGIKRITFISESSKKYIDDFIQFETIKYAYLEIE